MRPTVVVKIRVTARSGNQFGIRGVVEEVRDPINPFQQGLNPHQAIVLASTNSACVPTPGTWPWRRSAPAAYCGAAAGAGPVQTSDLLDFRP